MCILIKLQLKVDVHFDIITGHIPCLLSNGPSSNFRKISTPNHNVFESF